MDGHNLGLLILAVDDSAKYPLPSGFILLRKSNGVPDLELGLPVTQPVASISLSVLLVLLAPFPSHFTSAKSK